MEKQEPAGSEGMKDERLGGRAKARPSGRSGQRQCESQQVVDRMTLGTLPVHTVWNRAWRPFSGSDQWLFNGKHTKSSR